LNEKKKQMNGAKKIKLEDAYVLESKPIRDHVRRFPLG
jgi:hypothetical protein